MNNSQQEILQKMIELEEKLQNYDNQISILQKQKEHYQKQFLEISRNLASSKLFEKIKSEANGLAATSDFVIHHQGDDTFV